MQNISTAFLAGMNDGREFNRNFPEYNTNHAHFVDLNPGLLALSIPAEKNVTKIVVLIVIYMV